MEPSKIFGGNEECHSCESGWTMYIGSPIQAAGDDDGNSSDEADETEANIHDDDDDDEAGAESDDSMASDASSGPSHQAYFRDIEKEEKGDCYSDKKGKKSMEKQKLGLKKMEEKEQKKCKAKETTTTPSRSGSKVKLSIWPGKTK